MEKHSGQIVEYLVRKNGYSITELAAELGVNRRTIYNYFQNKFLKSDVIIKIGRVIRHDFSKEFPELFTSEDFSYPLIPTRIGGVRVADSFEVIEQQWKDKYLTLLEDYNALLLKKLKYDSPELEGSLN